MNDQPTSAARDRARAIADSGGVAKAIADGRLAPRSRMTTAEAVVIGLLKQGVRKHATILGHGNTALGEVLRIYDEAGTTRTYGFRNEIAMSHAVTALRWQYGERAALSTSIGPGAMQAMVGSLAASSNGIGVWHLYGDETTHDEGYNMQQIPKAEQGLFGRLTATMGESYVLHEPMALRAALRRGGRRVDQPYFAGPFYLLLPINVQPRVIDVNLDALPGRYVMPRVATADRDAIDDAARLIRRHRRIALKIGGGGRRFASEIRALAEAVDGVAVLSPGALGVLPDDDPRNMHVGGSKGSISGNFASAECDLLIVIGSRGVCQSDCSGTAFEKAEAVININGDASDAAHYNRTVALVGDIGANIQLLLAALGADRPASAADWRAACGARKTEWLQLRRARASLRLHDDGWGRPVLTQPTAIRVVAEFAKRLYGLCGKCDCRLRNGRSAPLHDRTLRRRLVHHESADPDRCRCAWRARHDRRLRQQAHGGDFVAAARTVWSRLRDLGRCCRRLCPHGQRGFGRVGLLWRRQRGKSQPRAVAGTCP